MDCSLTPLLISVGFVGTAFLGVWIINKSIDYNYKKNYKPTQSIQQYGVFAVGLPVKIYGGLHHNKKGIISKIIDHDPNCNSFYPELMIDIYVNFGEEEYVINEERIKLRKKRGQSSEAGR